MQRLAANTDGITLADAVTTLTLPPPSYANVAEWTTAPSGHDVVPEFDLEIWADAAISMTAAELFGAALHPHALTDDVLESADDTADTLTLTGHAYLSGDGPVRAVLGTGGGEALPGGVEAGVDYWVIVVDSATIQLAASFQDALNGAAIDITSAGTLTNSKLVDTATTQRVYWHSCGLLGIAGDGAIDLDTQKGYLTRRPHRPRVFAYGMVATFTGTINAAVYPIQDE